jgi:hypothetical protein
MYFACRREKFDKEAIKQFQARADNWFEKWIRFIRRDGLTNYTHLVSLGHFVFYMKEWGNLCCYSQ